MKGPSVEKTTYNEPRLAINRVYTRGGDKGETSLAGGERLPKDAPRIETYGTVDELNAYIGVARQTTEDLVTAHPALSELDTILKRVQHELFNVGSILATLPKDIHPRQPRVAQAEITQLEKEIDRMNEGLPELRSFVLPGGCRLNAELHVCRTVCRRAERHCVSLSREEEIDPDIVRYLNRLSDALFVWSRWASHTLGVPEILWEPNRAASGRQENQS